MNFRILFLVFLVLIVCSSDARRRRRRKNKKSLLNRQMDEMRNWREGHRRPRMRGFDLHNPRWSHLLDRLTRGWSDRQYSFGMGPREKPWFNFDFGWNFGGHQQGPWWQGPNVCMSKTESETNTTADDPGTISRHFSFQSKVCDETESAYRCTTTSRIGNKKMTMTEVYECCHGFTRKEIHYGCPNELKLKDLVDTARELGLTEFIRATDSVSLTEELRQGNFTVFAPTNQAFKGTNNLLPDLRIVQDMPNVVMVSKPLGNLVVSDMRNLLLGHLAVGSYKTSALQDEQLIETGSPYKAKIRINFYNEPQKMITANCHRVASTDSLATNGVIHTVDGIIQPVTGSLVDIISKTPQLGYLKTVLARAELVQTLRKDGQFTLFAPTDNAFKNLSPDIRDRLLKGNKECLKKVLQHHVLPNVICSAVIQGQAKTGNLLQNLLNLTRDGDSKLFVENTQIVETDIMATNGVLHLIDEVLIPDDALGILDIIEKNGETQILQLLKQARLLRDLEKAENVTFFVPSNEAIEKLPADTLRSLQSDPSYLRKVLQYHVVPATLSCNNLYNNYQLDTLADDKKIRINEYSSFPFGKSWVQTAQCAPIRQRNLPACNGNINVIDKLMLPPKGNVIDVLALNPKLSRLVELLKKAGLADSLQEEGPFTILAPTNEAFDRLGSKALKKLEENPDDLFSALQNHIVKDALCCAGFFRSNWFGNPNVWTLSGESFPLEHSRSSLRVGRAEVMKCDDTATNGVVHTIDSVLLKEETRDPFDYFRRRFFSDF